MPIRRSPNGARHTPPQAGRDRPEPVVAINRNAWSQSIGISGRNHPVRARRRKLKWLWARLKQIAAMADLDREELLMKLGAARAKARAAWRLLDVEVAADAATFT